jgi:hypothetical protein
MKFVTVPQPDPHAMKFYRFQDAAYADAHFAVERIFYMVRETPAGYWIAEWGIGEKWVSKDAKKRYAYPNRALAFESYIKRKEKQVKILTAQLATARQRLFVAQRGAPDPVPPQAPSGEFDF